MRQVFVFALLWGLSAVSATWASEDRDADARVLREALARVCGLDHLSGLAAQAAIAGSWLLEERLVPDTDAPRAVTVRLALPGLDELVLERRQHNGVLRQFRASVFRADGAQPHPKMLAIADGSCTIQSGRAMRSDGVASRYLDQLDGDLTTLRWTETLQAPWPEGADTGGVRVGLVDSGLAYDLPVFRDRLARDASGQPLGYDFWDLDPWPYDGDVSRGPFLPIRHGTAVASVLVREAPEASLVPYRYPRPDLDRMDNLLARAAEAGVRILAMPLGSRDRADWDTFATALSRYDMLAIVSAGNNGRDIDAAPIYPAALPSEQILTVTSADAFGRLAEGSNWGAEHVDIMVPAENVPIVDFRGATGNASGSSYAVPRVAAMAARLLAQVPDLSAMDLKQRVLDRATQSPFERTGVLRHGWIPNPLED